jgi:YbbR-like protein
MNWIGLITNEWRLKLLALGLAVLMLGAVAFSQNPPTLKSLSIPLNYTVKEGLIVINPPTKTTVVFQGLADVLSRVNSDNTTATVDATNVEPGPAVRVNIQVQTPVNGASAQQPAPIAINVDTVADKEIPVQIGLRAAPGWSITKAVAACPDSTTPDPCKVHFHGPASWQTNLTATATLPGNVSATTINFPNQRIQLFNSSGALDFNSIQTRPAATLDATTANLHVEAVAGVTSSRVPFIDAPPSHGPPAGYRITAVTISPPTVIITGDPAAVGRTRFISLPAQDLSESRADVTFQVAVSYPNGISGSEETVTIKYTIARNPNVP